MRDCNYISYNNRNSQDVICNYKEESILQFKNCISKIWSVNDKHNWPVKLSSISHLFAYEFSQDFIRVLDLLIEQGNTEKWIGESIGHPTTIFRCFDLLLKGMYQMNMNTVKKRNYIQFILNCIQSLKEGSIFNEDGRNLIISSKAVQTVCLEKMSKVDNKELAISLQQMIGLIKAYIEQLYFRGYDISQEIHGPYSINGERKLVIREFNHLAPNELWTTLQYVPFGSIKVYAIYNSKLELTIDAYGHMYQSKVTFLECLEEYGVEVDGKLVEAIKIQEIVDILMKCIQSNAVYLKKLTWQQITFKYADIFYYKLKPLFYVANDQPIFYENINNNIMNGQEIMNSDLFFQENRIQLLLNLLI